MIIKVTLTFGYLKPVITKIIIQKTNLLLVKKLVANKSKSQDLFICFYNLLYTKLFIFDIKSNYK